MNCCAEYEFTDCAAQLINSIQRFASLLYQMAHVLFIAITTTPTSLPHYYHYIPPSYHTHTTLLIATPSPPPHYHTHTILLTTTPTPPSLPHHPPHYHTTPTSLPHPYHLLTTTPTPPSSIPHPHHSPHYHTHTTTLITTPTPPSSLPYPHHPPHYHTHTTLLNTTPTPPSSLLLFVAQVSFVSTLVNQSVVQLFLFCNYRHRPGNPAAHCYPITTDARVWEAIMASTAAPGYLEEVKIGPHVYQVTR